MNRLKEKYTKKAVPELTKEFGYKNPHQVPRIEKVVVNIGVGRAVADSKHLENASESLALITGQRPVATVARKSIASFKVREGNKVGTTVTLRGRRAEEFLDLLISVVLPRIRDFRGVSRDALDPFGNYSLGLADWSVFPQLPEDTGMAAHGLQVNIVTTAKTKEEGRRLLEIIGLPMRRTA